MTTKANPMADEMRRFKGTDEKNPFEAMRFEGLLLPPRGIISLTFTVPAVVPWLFQSSIPSSVVPAVKYKMPFTFVRWLILSTSLISDAL